MSIYNYFSPHADKVGFMFWRMDRILTQNCINFKTTSFWQPLSNIYIDFHIQDQESIALPITQYNYSIISKCTYKCHVEKSLKSLLIFFYEFSFLYKFPYCLIVNRVSFDLVHMQGDVDKKNNHRDFGPVVKCLKSIHFPSRESWTELIREHKMIPGLSHSVLTKSSRSLCPWSLFCSGNQSFGWLVNICTDVLTAFNNCVHNTF